MDDDVAGLSGDSLFAVLLLLPLPDLMRSQLVCREWITTVKDESFLKLYCARRGWDWRRFIVKVKKREAKQQLRDAERGFVKRKSTVTYVDAHGQPDLMAFARKMFLRECARALRNMPGTAMLKDRELRASHATLMSFLDAVLERYPDCVMALNRRALLLFDEGRFDDAQRDLERCVELAPFFTDAIHNLGLCYHESQQLERALRCYGRAILIEGDCVSLNNRGLLFNDMKQNANAIADFLTIIGSLNPRYIDAWNNVAFAYNCVGRYEDALRCATRALELRPRLAEPHRIRAYSLLQLGRFQDAVTDCTKAIELYGQDKYYAKAHYTRGLALRALSEQLLGEWRALQGADTASADDERVQAECKSLLEWAERDMKGGKCGSES